MHILRCSPDLISAFKDVTLDSIKSASATPSPAASAPPPPPPAAAAPPAAPGSSYPTHMKVGVFSNTVQPARKSGTVAECRGCLLVTVFCVHSYSCMRVAQSVMDVTVDYFLA